MPGEVRSRRLRDRASVGAGYELVGVEAGVVWVTHYGYEVFGSDVEDEGAATWRSNA